MRNRYPAVWSSLLCGAFLSIISLWLMAAPQLAISAPQQDQREIAEGLAAKDAVKRRQALTAAAKVKREDAGQELRAALIAALNSENNLTRDRSARGGRGESLPELEDPYFYPDVVRAVVELNDPAAIPALAGAIGTGLRPIRAMVAFGEPAVPAVLNVVMSPDSSYSSYNSVGSALIALRFFVEQAETKPLSADLLEQIRRAARFRLSGRQFVTVLWNALDLAVVLQDPELRKIVETLALDPRPLMSSEFRDDVQVVEQTREKAAERLAGVPALPRP